MQDDVVHTEFSEMLFDLLASHNRAYVAGMQAGMALRGPLRSNPDRGGNVRVLETSEALVEQAVNANGRPTDVVNPTRKEDPAID